MDPGRIRKRMRVRNDNEKSGPQSSASTEETCDAVRATQTHAHALALAHPFWR
jgi:hypothetical protein